MAFQYSPKIVTDGLVLYLDAANTKSYVSGSTAWNDISRGGNNGTLVNGPTFSSDGRGSIVFDGTNDYVGTNSTVGNGTTLSTEAWFRTTNTGGQRHILAKGIQGQYQYAIRMGFSPNQNRTDFITWQAGSANYAGAGSEIITNDGNWHQFVGTIQQGVEIAAFVDGIKRNSNSSFTGTWNSNGTAEMRIGGRADGANPFLGNIAIVRIYNRVLSSQEILQNYNATKSRFGLT